MNATRIATLTVAIAIAAMGFGELVENASPLASAEAGMCIGFSCCHPDNCIYNLCLDSGRFEWAIYACVAVLF